MFFGAKPHGGSISVGSVIYPSCLEQRLLNPASHIASEALDS